MKSLKLPTDTTLERIFSFYVNSTEITEKEEQIRMRWEAAYSLILQYGNTQTVLPLLENKFEIKRAQAYRDINNCLKLYGDVNKSNKQAKRNLLSQLAMKIYELAAGETPPNLDQMTKALTLAAKVEGLDKEDPEMPDFKNFTQHNYNIVCDPKILGMEEIPDLEAKIAAFKKKKQIININGEQ
jgi:hypothetical protein